MPRLDEHLPESLRQVSEHLRLGPDVPSLVVRPISEDREGPIPFLFWMHGRTATKELDPGRYLRLARAGIGSCAIDLPGHGERQEDDGHDLELVLDHIEQAIDEIDDVARDLGRRGFDLHRMAIEGMSMGGMVALARLCRPHGFQAAILEATSGNWSLQKGRQFPTTDAADRLDPMRNLDHWREIPILAVHSRGDEWVDFEGQLGFLDAIRERGLDPESVHMMALEETGAPHEHLGFGRRTNEVKNAEVAFLKRHLRVD